MPIMHAQIGRIVTLAIGLAFVAGHAVAADTNPEGRKFPFSDDPMADVQQALDRAKENSRLLLVVTGANWCHDSRALASRLGRAPLADLIEQNYELIYVSVGYYERGRDVMQRFGVPHYYATPTVLIIDPQGERLMNDDDRHQWRNAYNIDMSESVQYFEKWLDVYVSDPSAVTSAELKRLYAEIETYEQQLADRVAGGYAVVGPMLEATDAGNRPDDFDANWDELSRFRGAVPAAIHELRNEALQRVAAGELDIELTYPEFATLSWEEE